MPDHSDPRSAYPLAERRPAETVGETGTPLEAITLASVGAGDVSIADLRISEATLRRQAEIARAAGRDALARNLERAAEMTRLPQSELLRLYDLLRPGRCRSKDELIAAAEQLSRDHGATDLAQLLRSAAEVYARRGLFAKRF
jgi:propanediol dehydratase small subunit